ncbi:phosphate propanoyltransferase [Bacillus rubiinfantis]|uniref:phosphate propanoyltransferase n=1 Tax=Bacillus rubiinfantis TaxID=1499680 RepID=UPI0005A67D66|nr:phosphate propanoyltransferase [Bacillus rubiinfantis]
MDQRVIEKIVAEVISRLQGSAAKERTIPIAVSARHCHLSQHDLEALFGAGYELTKKKDLSQPGQFAANETITIVGPRGSLENVRILGPARSLTQVEVSRTDAVKLGSKPPLRQSGDINGSAPITLVGPKGSIYKKAGLIIAQAHIHMSPDDAAEFAVNNGEYVSVEVGGQRPVTFGNVLIRVSPRYQLEMHVDTDEANATWIEGNTCGRIRKQKDRDHLVPLETGIETPPPFPAETAKESARILEKAKTSIFSGLLTQRDVQNCLNDELVVDKQTIITPLARDTAREMGISIKMIETKGAKK